MRHTLSACIACTIALSTFVAQAKDVSTPKGWDDEKRGETRIITRSTSRVEVGPWEDLGGLSLDAWLEEIADDLPSDQRLLKKGKAKPESLTGAYSITHSVKRAGQKAFTVFYACPGAAGNGRLIRITADQDKYGELFVGGMFASNVCKAETEGRATPELTAATKKARSSKTKSSPKPGTDLAAANAEIPDDSRPINAHVWLEKRWIGFPATLYFEATVALTFPNGYTTSCSNWSSARLSPTPKSVGRKVKDCKLNRGKAPDGKTARGFKPGETLNIKFGNVSGYDTMGASQLRGKNLVMTRDGRIGISGFSIGVLREGRNSATATNRKKGMTGRYYLDGYTITIETDDGEILHGFIAASVKKQRISAIYLAGEHFWDRKKK